MYMCEKDVTILLLLEKKYEVDPNSVSKVKQRSKIERAIEKINKKEICYDVNAEMLICRNNRKEIMKI